MTDDDREWLGHLTKLFDSGKLSRRSILNILGVCPHGVDPPYKCEDLECVAEAVLES